MVLYIDACVRKDSRTERLASLLLSEIGGEVVSIRLSDIHFEISDEAFLEKRQRLIDAGKFEDEMFAPARQFAEADIIVISAPYWDLSFPAALKQYIEKINVIGITFGYSQEGVPKGLCKAKRLYYVTTAGGTYTPEDYGFGYIQALARRFYGIMDVRLIEASGLDITGADEEAILKAAHENIRLEAPDLRSVVDHILDTNDIDYHFQPIISAKNGEIMGYEALMRMPAKYGINPMTLLKVATMENRLYDVERATFFNVLKKIEQMGDKFDGRKVFINSIPGYNLKKEDFRELENRFSGLFDKVVIEVTEETDIEEKTIELLKTRTREYGFQVAIDDFGTGYSTVTNLLKFLPNYVKIDRFLISEVHVDPRKQHFVNTIIQFAHDNGFMALAEGVETSEELHAVIGMGVDLIQGFYTARPEPQPLQELPGQLLNEISRANLDMVSNRSRQKIYTVHDERQLSLVDLVLQKYNILQLSGGELTLIGNPDFVSAVSVRIQDHAECRLTIRNVSIGDVDETPCIDLGKGSRLILNIEGDNAFTGNGIRVPESASLMLTGNGNLKIKPTFTNAYGIGNDYSNSFGRINMEMTGLLEIDISGENCVCIGGRSSVSEMPIELRSGVFKGLCAASNCVCIGSYEDKARVDISDMDITIDVRVATGAMIGTMNGTPDVHISHTALRIFGSGNHVTGIGAVNKSGGNVNIEHSSLDISFNGWNVAMIGAEEGSPSVECRHCRLFLTAESNYATGVGSRDLGASILLDNVAINMSISSANGLLFGCVPENFSESSNAFEIKLDGFKKEKDDWFKVNT